MIHRYLAALLVAGLVLGGLGASLAGASRARPDQTAEDPGRHLAIGPCHITATRSLAPRTVDLDAGVRVTTSVAGTCHDSRPLHLVLLVDASREMSDAHLDAVQSALISGVEALRPQGEVPVEIGLVVIGGRPGSDGSTIVSYLTADLERLVTGIRGLTAEGDPCLTCGITDAIIVLRNGRRSHPATDFREVILLASAGVEQSGCEAVQSAAREVRAQSILLVTACSGALCERRCLAEAASSPRYAFRTDEWIAVANMLMELRDASGAFHPLEGWSLNDEPAPGWRFTGDPALLRQDAIDWGVAPWPTQPMTVTYWSEPLACLTGPVSRQVELTVRMADGHAEVMPLTNPTLTVACAPPTRTSTPITTRSAPTATASTTTVTPTSGPDLTPTASATGPRLRAEAFLPLVVSAGCPETGGIDLVVLVDVSGSMAAPALPFETRWHAARQAVLDLIDGLRPDDRVAVIAYADVPDLIVGLTSDKETARRLTERGLPKADGSRMDRALVAGVAEVRAAGRADHRPRIALITDGDLNQTTEEDLKYAKSVVDSVAAQIHVFLVAAEPDKFRWAGLTGTVNRVHAYTPGAAPYLALAPRCRW